MGWNPFSPEQPAQASAPQVETPAPAGEVASSTVTTPAVSTEVTKTTPDNMGFSNSTTLPKSGMNDSADHPVMDLGSSALSPEPAIELHEAENSDEVTINAKEFAKTTSEFFNQITGKNLITVLTGESSPVKPSEVSQPASLGGMLGAEAPVAPTAPSLDSNPPAPAGTSSGTGGSTL